MQLEHIVASVLASAGLYLDAPMFEGIAPHMRTSKPMSHGRKCKRSLTERKARRTKRRQRAAT